MRDSVAKTLVKDLIHRIGEVENTQGWRSCLMHWTCPFPYLAEKNDICYGRLIPLRIRIPVVQCTLGAGWFTLYQAGPQLRPW